jgi:hypothetical protein
VTRTEAAKLVTMVLATWKTQASRMDGVDDVSTMISAWHVALRDLDGDVAASALVRLQATSRFMPSPADLRAAADEISRGARRAPAEAWGDVRKAIGRWGRNRPPGEKWNFEDPLVRRAVDALGWVELCESENAVADRARFIEVYRDVEEASRVEAVTATLPGAAAPKRIGGAASVEKLTAGIARKLALGQGTEEEP